MKDGALYGAPIPSEESLVECVSLGVWTWNQAAWACSADLGVQPHRASRYFHFEVNAPLPEPTHIVDITDTFADKMEAWKCFEDAHDHLGELDDALEARELIKITVLETADVTAKEAIEILAGRLQAEPVQCIGRKIVLYRRAKENPKIEL